MKKGRLVERIVLFTAAPLFVILVIGVVTRVGTGRSWELNGTLATARDAVILAFAIAFGLAFLVYVAFLIRASAQQHTEEINRRERERGWLDKAPKIALALVVTAVVAVIAMVLIRNELAPIVVAVVFLVMMGWASK